MVDEDCGTPTSLVENYRAYNGKGPLAQSDPREYLLSMSEYDKAQAYDVYGTYLPSYLQDALLPGGRGSIRLRPLPLVWMRIEHVKRGTGR